MGIINIHPLIKGGCILFLFPWYQELWEYYFDVMARKNNEEKTLTEEEFKELSEVSKNVFKFAKHCKIIHQTKGKMPFILYPYQKSLLYSFLENRFNVILKFRQAGVTELISLFCLWLAMYHPHKNIVIISIKDRVAKKVLRKIKFMYKNLPDHLKVKVVNGRSTDIGTASELEFSNGSMISSIPTTEEAGRSEAIALLVIDEAAIVRWAEKIWAAAFPTLSTGGSAIINSTAYGVGNFFHKLYVNSLVGGNPFTPIRLHWQMHPERDQKWYDEQRSILGPRRTAQEIDGDFLTSGNTVFDLLDIRTIEENLEEHPPIRTRYNGNLKIFEDPKPNTKYFLAMDIATGRSHDYTAFSIMDKAGDEKVCFKGKIPIDKATDLAYDFGKKYNWALLAPESNDIGLGVAVNLQKRNYKNLYYSRKLLKEKGESKPKEELIPGWYTTKKNRPLIIAELEEDIRLEKINIKDKFFVDESYTFIYDDKNKPVAMNKNSSSGDSDVLSDEQYTDDAILAKAITNHIRKGAYKVYGTKPA